MQELPLVSISQWIRNKDSGSLGKALKGLSGFEIADIVASKAEEEQLFIFTVLPPELAVEAFDYLSPKTQKSLIQSLPPLQVANMLKVMAPDDRTACLQGLPISTIDEYVKLLTPAERALVFTLLGYPEGSIGRLMTTDYITVKMDWTVEEALNHIRAYGHDNATINMIYVIDDNNVLLDDIKSTKFLLVPKEDTVSQLSDKKFVALSIEDSIEKAIQVFKQDELVALPVINERGVMLGVVTIDDILRVASQKNTDNFQRVGGTEALDESYMEIPFLELMKKRARWLVVLFIGEMFTATAMGFFEVEISKAVVLALFLPLIISSGGNAGSQSSTLIIRAMALGEVKLKDTWRVMNREILSGIFLGAVLGIIGFMRVTIWSSITDIYGVHWLLIAVTIGFALCGVVLWGSFVGSMLPLILKRCGADPATSSTPLVATLVDVTGIIIYFWIAMAILKGSLL